MFAYSENRRTSCWNLIKVCLKSRILPRFEKLFRSGFVLVRVNYALYRKLFSVMLDYDRFRSQVCKGRKEMFYLTTHSTHFIYGYMASDIWLRTILIVRKENRCRHIGYSFRLTASVILYAPSQTRLHIPRIFLHQSWSTGWNEK